VPQTHIALTAVSLLFTDDFHNLLAQLLVVVLSSGESVFAWLLIELLVHLFGFWDTKCIGKSNECGKNIARKCWMLTESSIFHSAGLLVDFLGDDQSNDSFLVFVAAVACIGVHAKLLRELEREFFGVAAHDRLQSAGFAFHMLSFQLSFFGKCSQLLHVNVHLFDVQALCQLLWCQ